MSGVHSISIHSKPVGRSQGHAPGASVKSIAQVVLFALLLGSCSKSSALQITYAWWLTEEYAATETEIESIPVGQLDKEWVRASVLSKKRLSPEGQNYLKERLMGKQDVYFALRSDFNKDGVEDKALVGVYETKEGEKGRFLLILSRPKDGKWKQDYLEVDRSKPGFSALLYREGKLSWIDCFECDGFPDVIWEKNHYELKYPEPEG